MNDRNLAIQVSKHPLIKKLLETKIATTSVVARLIVEEMMHENDGFTSFNDAVDSARQQSAGEQEGENYRSVVDKYYNYLKQKAKEFAKVEGLITLEQWENIRNGIARGPHAEFRNKILNSTKIEDNEKTRIAAGASSLFDQAHDVLYKKVKQDYPSLDNDEANKLVDGFNFKGPPKSVLPTMLEKASELGLLEQVDGDVFIEKDNLAKIAAAVNKDENMVNFGEGQKDFLDAMKEAFAYEGNDSAMEKLFYNYKEIKAALGSPKPEPEKQPEQENKPQQPNLPEIPGESKEKYMATKLYTSLKTNEQKQAILYFLYFYENATIAEEEAKGPFDNQPDSIKNRIKQASEKVKGVSAEMAQQLVKVLRTEPQLVVDAIKELTAEPEAGAEDTDGDEKQTENPFKDLPGYSELTLTEDQENLFIRLLSFLSEAGILKEVSIRDFYKDIEPKEIRSGLRKSVTGFMNSLETKEEKEALLELYKMDQIQNFIKSNLKGIEQSAEEEPEQQGDTGEEAEEEEKVEDFQVSENTLAALKGSVEEFITEFYEVPFLTDQAKLVKAIMNALAEVKKELEKEPEQQARMQGQRRQQNEQEEPAPASEDLLKNIRVDLRAFLKLTKKTKVALKTFKSNAEKGSFMTDSSKEEFMKLIARLQMTIAEIVGELKKMSPINEQEQQPQEEKEDWEKAQDFYNDAADALDGLVGVLDDGGTKGEPIELIGTASKNLFSLTQFFPSVNPFSAGKKDLGDITEYDAEFDEAVKEVKSHVQSILALVKEKLESCQYCCTVFGCCSFAEKR